MNFMDYNMRSIFEKRYMNTKQLEYKGDYKSAKMGYISCLKFIENYEEDECIERCENGIRRCNKNLGLDKEADIKTKEEKEEFSRSVKTNERELDR